MKQSKSSTSIPRRVTVLANIYLFILIMTVIVASMCIVCALLFLFLGNTEALTLMRSELRVATSPSVQTKTSPSDRVHSCLLLYRG